MQHNLSLLVQKIYHGSEHYTMDIILDTSASNLATTDTRHNCYGESQGELMTAISHTGPLCASNTKRGVPGQRDVVKYCYKAWSPVFVKSFSNLNKDLKFSYKNRSNIL